jgi:hypothetical protein
VTITLAERRAWHAASDTVAQLYRDVVTLAAQASSMDAELRATIGELQSRVGALYGNVMRNGTVPTTDQRRQMAYFPTVLRALRQRVAR